MKKFNIDPKQVEKKLVNFISKTVRSRGFDKVILGLSGGIDSAVVAYLSAKALGRANVIGVIMPYADRQPQCVSDAKKVARLLGIKKEYVDISNMVDVYFSKAKDIDKVRRGNKMARERMSILFDLSKKYHALVIGTSNRTETLLGYGTLHGDCAWSLNPVGGLYKTQLRQLAAGLGVPRDIIDKAPTAGLWPGQTDEGEIGYLYKDIDMLLFGLVDKGSGEKELIREGFDRKFVRDIKLRIKKNRFKSEQPPVALL